MYRASKLLGPSHTAVEPVFLLLLQIYVTSLTAGQNIHIEYNQEHVFTILNFHTLF